MGLALVLAGCAEHPLINTAAIYDAKPPAPIAPLPPPIPLGAAQAAPETETGADAAPQGYDPFEGGGPDAAPPYAAAPYPAISGGTGIQREPMPPLLVEPEAPVSSPSAPTVPRPAAPPDPASADPARRTAALLRSNPWLSRFWSELNPAQRSRVTDRLQGGQAARSVGDVAAAWDRMGLAERTRLIYGAGA